MRLQLFFEICIIEIEMLEGEIVLCEKDMLLLSSLGLEKDE